MSVICKVSINSVANFGENKLVKTSCIAENEVMAAYNPEAEDKLFTKYSPSGTADFVVPSGFALDAAPAGMAQTKLYLMFVKEESPALAKALAYAKVYVRSITDFGGTSKVFEITTDYSKGEKRDWRQIHQFNHRITIDNPGASDQFNAGDKGWWVGIYSAEALTMAEVIQDAHA